jgi:hypothetical protein
LWQEVEIVTFLRNKRVRQYAFSHLPSLLSNKVFGELWIYSQYPSFQYLVKDRLKKLAQSDEFISKPLKINYSISATRLSTSI